MNIITFIIIGLSTGWLSVRIGEEKEVRNIMNTFFISISAAFAGGYIFDIFQMPENSFWDKTGMSLAFAVISIYIFSFFQYEGKNIFKHGGNGF